MASIKLVYIGGGSTRAPGTVASLLEQGENFNGSEIVLYDIDPSRLEIVSQIARKMARNRGLDFRITTSTDRRAALTDCDAVLTSYRPGRFRGAVPGRKHFDPARTDRPGNAGAGRLLHGHARRSTR